LVERGLPVQLRRKQFGLSGALVEYHKDPASQDVTIKPAWSTIPGSLDDYILNARWRNFSWLQWHICFLLDDRFKGELIMDQLIRFRCECGKKLKATRDIIGKKVRCTKCPRTHRVPESDCLPPKETAAPVKSVVATEAVPKDTAATSPGKKKRTPKPATKEKSIAMAGSQASSNDVFEKPNLIIRDQLSAKEPSLLPVGDDSDSRFKLDPKFDPAPTDAPVGPCDSFEFDFEEDTSIDQEPTAEQELAGQRHLARTSSRAVAIVAAAVGVLLLSVIGWFAFG